MVPPPLMISHVADLADIAGLAWPRRTDRLLLRPVTKDDFEALWQIRRQESVGRWMTSTSRDRDEFATMMSDPDRMGRTLVIERDGAVVGDLMISPQDAWAQIEVAPAASGVQAEIGWCLDPALEGQGYATEAVRELIRICFDELHLRRLLALAFAANESSRRLMERVGMRQEAYNVADSLHRSGEWMDGISFALLAEEWRDLRGADQGADPRGTV